ncbi:hypothetical protein OS493_017155 [Desmophyllum pertusum]|uniref:Uncharacterized protein n=1 Tax=Desmophyllum pertusum TaxID=174260 RepID=A0A9X0CGS0_9CNID|nr:hypothetical protein OS493_017155 [Desmophyllum pertusum]
MKRANTVPSPGAQNGPQTVSNDATPKGRYKSVLLTPRRGLPSCSTLTPGFLRSFGFANTKSSSQPETTEPSVESSQQTESTVDADASNVQSADSSSLLPPQEDNLKGEKHIELSESQINLLSHNLSEIADRISPSKYDSMIEMDCDSLETLMDDNIGQSPQATFSNTEQARFKTPYARRRKDSKSYVSKQKSFTRKKSQGHHNSHQETNNNDEISVDASNVLSLGNPEAFKHDSESDSGYSSSMSTSISLSDEIEVSKRLSSSTDIDTDELTIGGGDLVRRNSVDKAIVNESSANTLVHQNSSFLEERLDSLIHGMSAEINNLNLNGGFGGEKDAHSEGGGNEPSPSFKLSFIKTQEKDESKEKSKNFQII